MKVSGAWLHDPAAQAVFALLEGGGFQAFAVGGCVRNEILGMPVQDVDFATNARPDQVLTLAKKAGLAAVPTGIEHGTITLVCGGTGFEVTTFRKDIKTDGRRAVVAFADTLSEDARRRDFTMNALYARADGTVIDPLGGLADIRAQRVRFIDDANERIREDYLRILRFFRFHAWYGDPDGGFDADALAACAAEAEGLELLSKERIGAEFGKLLSAPDPAPSVAVMGRSGILARILPGADAAALAVLVHLEGETATQPDNIRRLAVLGGQDQATNLRLSRADQKRLQLYLTEIGSGKGLAELAYRHGADTARDVVLLRAAMQCAGLPSDLAEAAKIAADRQFPVRAADLMDRYQGAALGAKLKSLEKRWIDSGFTLTRAELLA
ncbi:MAG: CCA tRNA nucleotidyltransferase [Rhodobacteraceae bacterium]|nr:CCA tRNA nucleotidyltransferase [Paracoccaceae bacterium]